jgi:hypothetical protein
VTYFHGESEIPPDGGILVGVSLLCTRIKRAAAYDVRTGGNPLLTCWCEWQRVARIVVRISTVEIMFETGQFAIYTKIDRVYQFLSLFRRDRFFVDRVCAKTASAFDVAGVG